MYADKKGKGKGKGPFYLTSVVPSVLQTRDCYQWKPTVRPLPPLPLSVLRFTGIPSYGYTDQRKVEADVEVTEDRTGDLSLRKPRTSQLSHDCPSITYYSILLFSLCPTKRAACQIKPICRLVWSTSTERWSHQLYLSGCFQKYTHNKLSSGQVFWNLVQQTNDWNKQNTYLQYYEILGKIVKSAKANSNNGITSSLLILEAANSCLPSRFWHRNVQNRLQNLDRMQVLSNSSGVLSPSSSVSKRQRNISWTFQRELHIFYMAINFTPRLCPFLNNYFNTSPTIPTILERKTKLLSEPANCKTNHTSR